MIRFLKNTQKKKFIGKEIKCEGGKSDLSTDFTWIGILNICAIKKLYISCQLGDSLNSLNVMSLLLLHYNNFSFRMIFKYSRTRQCFFLFLNKLIYVSYYFWQPFLLRISDFCLKFLIVR